VEFTGNVNETQVTGSWTGILSTGDSGNRLEEEEGNWGLGLGH